MRKLKSAEELKALLIKYAPNKQLALCHNAEQCYFNDIPTLGAINKEYDKMAAVAWLIPQLTDIAEFSNCKVTFSEGQIRNCAEIIATEYHYLKLSEMMLFFYRFKLGNYGRFYGSVSPMMIMSAIKDFLQERGRERYNIENSLI